LHPNIRAVIDKISKEDLAKKLEFERYVHQRIKPCKDYFSGQLLKHRKSFMVGQAARYFSPLKITSISNENMLNEFSVFPWISPEMMIKLEEELPRYKILAQSVVPEIKLCDWWRNQLLVLPCWSNCFYWVILYQSSSGAAERVGSIFHQMYSDGNHLSLEDYVEASVMVQYNYR